jgi:hypothetical protein
MADQEAEQAEMEHAAQVASYLKNLRSALEGQTPFYVEHYEMLQIPDFDGRINYLGAGSDFVTPWLLGANGSDEPRHLFKMVDAYSHELQMAMIDLCPPCTKIVVAHDSAPLERIIAKKGERPCINVVLYHKDRSADYAATIGKPFLDLATTIITDDMLGHDYKLLSSRPQVAVPAAELKVPTPDGSTMMLTLPRLLVYQKKR